jgi:ACR3 family arsenite efflux pump ArsB
VLTPKQDKAIDRIQFVGVVLLIGIMIAMKVLASSEVIDGWTLPLVGLSAMVALVALVGFVVSRVEQRPYREVMSSSLRGAAKNVKGSPARLRQRVDDTIARLRSH